MLKKLKTDLEFYENELKTAKPGSHIAELIFQLTISIKKAINEQEMIELNSESGDAEDRYHR